MIYTPYLLYYILQYIHCDIIYYTYTIYYYIYTNINSTIIYIIPTTIPCTYFQY